METSFTRFINILYCDTMLHKIKLPHISSISDEIEVIIRLFIMTIMALTLSFGNYVAVPQSQAVLISAATVAFGGVAPTLMFSVGVAFFPDVVFMIIIALLISTALLAIAAVGGREAYVVCYFVFACFLAGLRFTSQAANTNTLMMFSALNTIGLYGFAEKYGLPFVAALWTEKGTTNPGAAFRNTLIAACWIIFCCSVPRLLPPVRTLRKVMSTKLLPKMMMDMADFIKLVVEHHGKNNEELNNSNIDSCKNQADTNRVIESKIFESKLWTIIHYGTLTMNGGVANLTAFEPRILRFICCGPPDDSVGMLRKLVIALNKVIFSVFSLRAFSKAGKEELETGGLRELYLHAATNLERCAKALIKMEKLEEITPKTENEGNVQSDIEADKKPFDPVLLDHGVDSIIAATNDFVSTMGPIDESKELNKEHAMTKINRFMNAIKPWLMGKGIDLFLQMFKVFPRAFRVSTWQGIIEPPYRDLPKAMWGLKFAIGFEALVCMSVYWPAFANLIVPVNDQGDPVQSAHFAGWHLIAYAFATTLTVEGSWAKGILRFIGTCLGAFSAWLALTFFGKNPYGLVIWLAITCTIAVYVGLPKGTKSRMGLNRGTCYILI